MAELVRELRVDGQTCAGYGASRLLVVPAEPRPLLSWRWGGDAIPERWDVQVWRANSLVWHSPRRGGSAPRARLGLDLPPYEQFVWRVRGQHAGEQVEEAIGRFTTGPLTLDQWHARWLSVPAGATVTEEFSVVAPPARAVLHLTAQGRVRAGLNGEVVNPGAVDPSRTDIVRALYRTYDVTDLVVRGLNALQITLGHGEWHYTGLDPRILALVVLTDDEGRHDFVRPHLGSSVEQSQVSVDEPFYLERHRTTRPRRSMAPPTMPSVAVLPAEAASAPARVEPDTTPPVHTVATASVVEIHREPGVRVFDAGVNVAGRSRVLLRCGVPRGTMITLVHGEHVDHRTRVDTTNLRLPHDAGRERQVLEWEASGRPDECVEAWFAYHGFRYFEVSGLPDAAVIDASVNVIHSDLAADGHITTDVAEVNRLVDATRRTLLNNVHSVPEDCPTREQAAWTGDAASVSEFFMTDLDAEAFAAKWLIDMATSQRANGEIPAISPESRPHRHRADPVWGAALPRTLLNHWLHFGDADVVRQSLPVLRRWARFLLSCRDEAGVVSEAPMSYGQDWLGLEQTPPPLHHTHATIECLATLARIEAEVGDPILADEWSAQAVVLRQAARQRFCDAETGAVGNGTQGALACALEADLLTPVERLRTVEALTRLVRQRGNRVASGFATTRTVVRALAHGGRSDVVLDVLRQREAPGIGAMLRSPTGTLWECWWLDPTNTGTGSLDHVGLGGPFASWVWEHVVGIRPTERGFGRFVIEPAIGCGVRRVSARLERPAGIIQVSYQVDDGRVHGSADVPNLTTARLRLGGEATELGPGHHEFATDIPAARQDTIRPDAPDAPEGFGWPSPLSAQRAADVDGVTDLLARALGSSGGVLALDGTVLTPRQDGLDCKPVPHAQLPGPLVRVETTAALGDLSTGIRIRLPPGLVRGGAGFLYALIDFCNEHVPGTPRAVMRVRTSTGKEDTVVQRLWHAGWSRVAVDLQAWPSWQYVTTIEITLAGPDHETEDGRHERSTAFTVGEVGHSTSRRLW